MNTGPSVWQLGVYRQKRSFVPPKLMPHAPHCSTQLTADSVLHIVYNLFGPMSTYSPTAHLPNWLVLSVHFDRRGSLSSTVTLLIHGIHVGMSVLSSHRLQHTSSGAGTSSDAL